MCQSCSSWTEDEGRTRLAVKRQGERMTNDAARAKEGTEMRVNRRNDVCWM